MYIIPFFIIALCNYSIAGITIDVDVKIKESTRQIGVTSKQDGNISIYTLKAEGDNIIGRILDNKAVIYRRVENDGFQNLNVLYPKGSTVPLLVKLGFKNNKLSFTHTSECYYNFQEGWEKITEKFFEFTINTLNRFMCDKEGVLKFPKFIKVDLNKRESNDAIDVECNKEGDDKWNIKFIPKKGYGIVAVIANGEVVWKIGEDCKLPSEVKLSISDDALVSLTFSEIDAKNPEIITCRPHPGLSSDFVSGHDDTDITKKATLISSTDVDDEEEDEQGVIEDTTAWTDGIEVTEEDKKKLDEYIRVKDKGEPQGEFVLTETIEEEKIEEKKHEIEPEADLGEAEGELIEEGTTPSGEDIEPEADLGEAEERVEEVLEEEEQKSEVDLEEMEEEEVILPDYYLDDYFKDLKPLTLDIYNHETEGLDIKVKQYPNHSSTIYTCIPKKGYIIDSLYDSQRRETVWRKYKHDKYTVVAIVYTRKTQLIVLFVIDVNPQKSKVLYYRNLPSFGWRERYRESLDQCYLDTIIKGEWRISEKVL